MLQEMGKQGVVEQATANRRAALAERGNSAISLAATVAVIQAAFRSLRVWRRGLLSLVVFQVGQGGWGGINMRGALTAR